MSADEHIKAATKRTVDLDRGRVLDLLHAFERFVRGGGGDHWDSVGGDRHQAVADVRYAIDAVRRFPVDQLPTYCEDCGRQTRDLATFPQPGGDVDICPSCYRQREGDRLRNLRDAGHVE